MTSTNELRLAEALSDLAEAARNACDARRHTPLIDALEEADSALIASREAAVKPLGDDATGSADWWKHRALAAEVKNRSMFDEKASLTRELDKAGDVVGRFLFAINDLPKDSLARKHFAYVEELAIEVGAALSATADLGRDTENAG